MQPDPKRGDFAVQRAILALIMAGDSVARTVPELAREIGDKDAVERAVAALVNSGQVLARHGFGGELSRKLAVSTLKERRLVAGRDCGCWTEHPGRHRVFPMQWEFTYVDLWLGQDQDISAVNACHSTIARLGQEGWEPVGEVNFKFRGVLPGGDTNVRLLMLKRPASTG